MRGARRYLVGSLVLVALAGCGRGILQYAEREPWRREAETACLKSGAVREAPGLVRIEPIEGPGVCGADYPLKVAALGEGSAFGFANEAVRPPGSIPGASQPRWPIAEPRTAPPPQPRYVTPAAPLPPLDQRYATPSVAPRYAPPGPPGAPLSLDPPGVVAASPSPPMSYDPRRPATAPIEQIDDEELQRMPQRPPAQPLPALGPPRVTGTVPVEVKPAATLACPIVSALDQWIAAAVQPAAQKWFGQPVVEIKQISAYSCRGMNGQRGARISEHAFGNALDIAAFVLADGRRITVKGGWQGSPEEQGFLRDVQGAACEQFTTVLAPGSNRFHYDHIHVDLMRRASGRRICQPYAVDGEQVAAQARRNQMVAGRSGAAPPIRRAEPFDSRNDPFAWRGARRGDPTPTGSIGPRQGAAPSSEDDDWVEDDAPRPPIDWSTSRRRDWRIDKHAPN